MTLKISLRVYFCRTRIFTLLAEYIGLLWPAMLTAAIRPPCTDLRRYLGHGRTYDGAIAERHVHREHGR